MERQYTTIRGWVDLTGISRSQTYNLLADGHIRAVKVGTRVLIHLPSALAWLTAQPAARPRKHHTGSSFDSFLDEEVHAAAIKRARR